MTFEVVLGVAVVVVAVVFVVATVAVELVNCCRKRYSRVCLCCCVFWASSRLRSHHVFRLAFNQSQTATAATATAATPTAKARSSATVIFERLT